MLELITFLNMIAPAAPYPVNPARFEINEELLIVRLFPSTNNDPPYIPLFASKVQLLIEAFTPLVVIITAPPP